MKSPPRACVIGAGSSGITVVKALYDRGVHVDCFEKSDRVGGNWVFKNKNGVSSSYRSLHINTSRDRMQYTDYPMPRSYPDFPHHTLIARYFDAYVDHFGIRHTIRFETGVEKVVSRGGSAGDSSQELGRFEVTLASGEALSYDAVVVANGHHWDPQWPDPPFPGAFDGLVMHAHHYIDPGEPHDLNGKRVVVVGMGNSAMDIACELSRPGVSDKVFLSARRGAYVVPNYVLGKPLDQLLTLPPWLPFWAQSAIGGAIFRVAVGKMEDYGLPKPDHRIGEAHPTISSELLIKLGRGDITPKSTIAELMGNKVRFDDGSIEEVDAIVYCTGYKVTFPFFDQTFVAAKDNDLPLYLRAVKPDVPGLYFAGLLQPLGAIMPLAEAQGRWFAELVTGAAKLPSRAEMEAAMRRERQTMFQRYVPSKRHTMQVDFDAYLIELGRAVEEGRRRAAMGAQGLSANSLTG